MEHVKNTKIKDGSVGIWAIGQSGFLFKDSRGMIVVIDPCLTDPVAKALPDWKRLYPPPVKPEKLCCDVLITTHDHLDHLDPDTILRLTDGAVGHFVGPGNCCRHLKKLGVPEHRILRLDASESIQIGDLEISGVMAVTNDSTQPDAEGIFLQFHNAPSIYHTGDTAFHSLLADMHKKKPCIYMPCINGKYGNMNCREAAILAAVLRSRWAVPHHYDMFRENLADPGQFCTEISSLAPETECVILPVGGSCIFS